MIAVTPCSQRVDRLANGVFIDLATIQLGQDRRYFDEVFLVYFAHVSADQLTVTCHDHRKRQADEVDAR